jgi:hypothetical protein
MGILIDLFLAERGRDSTRDNILSTAVDKIAKDHTIGLTDEINALKKEMIKDKNKIKCLEEVIRALKKMIRKSRNTKDNIKSKNNNECDNEDNETEGMVDGNAIQINDTQEIVYSSRCYLRKCKILDILMKGKKNNTTRKIIDECLVKLSRTKAVNNFMFDNLIYHNLKIRDIVIKKEVDSDEDESDDDPDIHVIEGVSL